MNEDNQQVPKSKDSMSITRKIIYFPLTKIIIGVIVCFLVPASIKGFVIKPIIGLLNLEENIAKSIQGVFSILFFLSTYYFLFKYYEKREISELSRKLLLKEMLLGFFTGAIIISLVIFILYSLGYYELHSINNVAVLLTPLIFLIVMSVFEEIIFRGVIYRITEESLGTNLALIVSALIFGMVHLINKDANIIYMISATLGGILLGILFSFTRRLWVPIFFHLGWNFTQFFYGTNRFMDEFSFFLESKLKGPELLTGGKTGIENSIFAIIFILILFAVIYYLTLKKGNIRKPYWKTKKYNHNSQ